MPAVFVVRRTAQAVERACASMQAELELQVVGRADHLSTAYRALRELSQTHLPHVLVSDLCLIDGNLPKLLRVMKADGHQAKVLVIATSADDALLYATMRAGAHSYLIETANEPTPNIASAMTDMLAGLAPMSPMVAREVLLSIPLPRLPWRRLSDWVELSAILDREPVSTNSILAGGAEHLLLSAIAYGVLIDEIAQRTKRSKRDIARHVGRIYEMLHQAD